MAHVTLSHTLTNGTPEDASQVQENFIDITDQVNGSLDYTNLSESAAIKGTQLSTTYKIPTDRLAADCVTKDILKDDATAGAADAAVNSSAHIKDGIVTKAKISGKLAMAQLDVSVQEVSFTISGLNSGSTLVATTIYRETASSKYNARVYAYVQNFSAGVLFSSAGGVTVNPTVDIPVATMALIDLYLADLVWSDAANTLTGKVVFVSAALT